MQIEDYIKQPYPFYYDELKKVFLLLCSIALTSFVFTYLFDPFVVNVDEHKIDSLWIVVLHSVIPIPVAFVYLFLLKKSVKNIENWTLGKEFLHLIIILFIIGLFSFLIRDLIYTNPDNWSFRYLWEEIRNTFLVGSLILLIILPLNLERLISKHLKGLKTLTPHTYQHQQHIIHNNSSIKIVTSIKEENFELNIPSFLYAKVDSNYLEIFYKETKEKELKRLTLKEFGDQLNSCPFIFRVHRSYMVNLNEIESITGNAQGYKLSLKNYSQRVIPVSRSKIEEFNQVYTSLKKQ